MKISEIKDFVGKEVELRGWVYRKRDSKDVSFVVLRDSSGSVQCIVKDTNPNFQEALKTTMESSVELTGIVKEDKRAPGGYEIQVKDFQIVGLAERFPITQDQSAEFLLDVRHLWIRSKNLTTIAKIKATVLQASREYFDKEHFFETTPPILVSAACEGGSTLFGLKYFDQDAFLSQSAQLYLEALITSLEKVWSLTPSFRAEKSRTRRHLAEYWHLEEEAAWTDTKKNMDIQEGLVFHILQKVLEKHEQDLKSLGRNVEFLKKIKTPFPRITYTEALGILEKKGIKLKWGDDMGVEEERVLTEEFDKPFFVTCYPKDLKAFYMKENPEDPKTVLNNDMLAPEGFGEIIGGSERETDLNKLIEKIKNQGGDPKNYDWYLDLRRFGSVPHSGFGLGVERLVMWICGLEHIRDAVPFPRVINRVYP